MRDVGCQGDHRVKKLPPPHTYIVGHLDGPANALLLRNLQRRCFNDIIVEPDHEGSHWWHVLDRTTGRSVGFASVQPSLPPFEKTVAYLSSAGILKAHRGHGLQTRLIRVRLRWAQREGYRWAVTETVQNPSSAKNLIDCGFRPFKPRKPWTYKDAHYWRVAL